MAHDEFDDFSNPYRAPVSKLEIAPPVGPTTTYGIDLAVDNPWLTIWTRPRATIRGIVDHDPTYRVVPVATASGILQVVNQMIQKNAGDDLPAAGLLGVAAVMGPLAGILHLYLGGWWFSNMGRIFGGGAQSRDVRTVVAWSAVPSFATVPFLILATALLGKQMFMSKLIDSPGALATAVLVATAAIQVLFGVWSGVVFLKGLGEVHGFSAWRALACSVVPVLLLLLSLGVVVGIIMVAAR